MTRIFAAALVRPQPLVLALLTATVPTCASASLGSWYVGGAVTRSLLDDPHQTIANAPTPGSTLHVVNDTKSGWGAQGEVGYTLRIFRFAAEVGYTSNHSDRYSAIRPIALTLPQSGKNRVTRYMANAYMEPFVGRWAISPFVGVGIGAAHGKLTTFAAPARAPGAPPSELLDINDTRFAYQLMGGLSVPLTRRVAFSAQYRWLNNGTFHGADARGERASRTVHGSNIDVGLRFAL